MGRKQFKVCNKVSAAGVKIWIGIGVPEDTFLTWISPERARWSYDESNSNERGVGLKACTFINMKHHMY